MRQARLPGPSVACLVAYKSATFQALALTYLAKAEPQGRDRAHTVKYYGTYSTVRRHSTKYLVLKASVQALWRSLARVNLQASRVPIPHRRNGACACPAPTTVRKVPLSFHFTSDKFVSTKFTSAHPLVLLFSSLSHSPRASAALAVQRLVS
jgi:hypothetical protein